MPNLFDHLQLVTGLPHGWCSYEKAKMLSGIVLATRPRIVVEIGVWSGRSVITCALACQEVGHGKCYGIDPFEAAASVVGMTGLNAEWWNRPHAHEEMLEYFHQQVIAFGVADTVELVRDRSDDVNPLQWDAIHLLHLDGNHGPQVLRDTERFSPRIPIGGFAVLDDLHWEDGGVSQAVAHLLQNGFIEHFRVQKQGDDWAVLQRIELPKP